MSIVNFVKKLNEVRCGTIRTKGVKSLVDGIENGPLRNAFSPSDVTDGCWATIERECNDCNTAFLGFCTNLNMCGVNDEVKTRAEVDNTCQDLISK